MVTISDSNCTSNSDYSVSNWFHYPIHNISSPTVASIITRSGRLLRDTNVFVIPQFLSSLGLSRLQNDILSVHYNKQQIYRTVFQDQGDLLNFPNPSHSRNHVSFVQLGHTNRNDLPQSFEKLYEYKPLLKFLQTVVDKSEIYHVENGENSLYLSKDKEGAIYSLIGEVNDIGGWHYDQHPFSCVWMIHKPNEGGILQSIQFEPNTRIWNNIDDEYWDLLNLIWNQDTSIKHWISNIEVDEGAMYCFTGNNTLHQVTKIEGNKARRVIVMAYAPTTNFAHSDDISNINFFDGIFEVVQPQNDAKHV